MYMYMRNKYMYMYCTLTLLPYHFVSHNYRFLRGLSSLKCSVHTLKCMTEPYHTTVSGLGCEPNSLHVPAGVKLSGLYITGRDKYICIRN